MGIKVSTETDTDYEWSESAVTNLKKYVDDHDYYVVDQLGMQINRVFVEKGIPYIYITRCWGSDERVKLTGRSRQSIRVYKPLQVTF